MGGFLPKITPPANQESGREPLFRLSGGGHRAGQPHPGAPLGASSRVLLDRPKSHPSHLLPAQLRNAEAIDD